MLFITIMFVDKRTVEVSNPARGERACFDAPPQSGAENAGPKRFRTVEDAGPYGKKYRYIR